MDDLKKEQAYIDTAAKLKAKGDAFKNALKKIIKTLIFLMVVIIALGVALYFYTQYQQNEQTKHNEAKRVEQSEKLAKVAAGLKSSTFCYINLNNKECVNLFFVEDTDYHVIMQENNHYHLFKPDYTGFLDNQNADFSSSNPFDYATLYPRKLTSAPWLEAFEVNGKTFKLVDDK